MNPDKWKLDALRKMNRSRSATLDVLAKLTPAQIRRPKTQGKWAIRDVIAHIVAWEQEACKRLDMIMQGKADQIHFYDSKNDTDAFNARAVKRFREHTFPALLRQAEEVRKELVARVRSLPPEEIMNPAHHHPVSVWLPEFAWTHEESHRSRIYKFIRKV